MLIQEYLTLGPYYSDNDMVGMCFDDTDYPGKVTFTSYRNRSQGTVPADGRVLVSKLNSYY